MEDAISKMQEDIHEIKICVAKMSVMMENYQKGQDRDESRIDDLVVKTDGIKTDLTAIKATAAANAKVWSAVSSVATAVLMTVGQYVTNLMGK